MTLSLYEAAVPTCTRALENLAAILGKAAHHAEQNGIDASVLLNARLYPDMFPFVRQVQIATDIANRGVARLAGQVPASMPDEETTFEQLGDRIRHTLELLGAAPREAVDAGAERTITFPLRGREVTFEANSYLFNFVLPNVFFHVATAYAILRHNGVPLGKADFLGQIP